MSKRNQYSFKGKVGTGTASQGQTFLFDKEDYDKIKDYCWRVSFRGDLTTTSKSILMHRLVMDCPKGMTVDHINHNRLDNRKSNLRVCTLTQNNWNKLSKGVRLSNSGKWEARIYFNGKEHHLGTYDTYSDAKQARIAAEKALRGEYAYAHN